MACRIQHQVRIGGMMKAGRPILGADVVMAFSRLLSPTRLPYLVPWYSVQVPGYLDILVIHYVIEIGVMYNYINVYTCTLVHDCMIV